MILIKRLFITLLLIVWFLLVLFPFFAFKLAKQGEMHFNNTRIFLVQDSNNNGVGFHTTKAANEPIDCTINRISYLLWEGEADNTSTCYCQDGIERVPNRNKCG